MSFRKKLPIIAMISSLLSGSFVNASECTKNVWITIGNRPIRVSTKWYDKVVSQGIRNVFAWAPDDDDIISDKEIYFSNPNVVKSNENIENADNINENTNNIVENVNNNKNTDKVNYESSSINENVNNIEMKEVVPENILVETKFSSLLNGLNFSKPQIDLSRKMKFNMKPSLNTKYLHWCNEKKMKLYFDISLSELNNGIDIKIYYYNINNKLKKNINSFMQDENNKEHLLNHFQKFVAFVNDYDVPNCEFKSPLSFTKLLRFRMVVNNKCNGRDFNSYIALKDKDGNWRELDYSKYSKNDLLDLCKYFVYCIPNCIFSN